MLSIDLNADMGEGYEYDEALMDWVSSVNIACGYHAGNEDTMKRTITLARARKKAIGAHPSYPDRENFGRKEMQLPPGEIYRIVLEQLNKFALIAMQMGILPDHVKPHGALYNSAARDKDIARAIANAVFESDPRLILFGLSGSQLIVEAQKLGLQTASEVFADRTYQEDGSLTPRSAPGAMISSSDDSVRQVIQMIQLGSVTSLSGKKIELQADTVCVHGDEPNAVLLAKHLHQELSLRNIEIAPPAKRNHS